jgi:hypothetical protein
LALDFASRCGLGVAGSAITLPSTGYGFVLAASDSTLSFQGEGGGASVETPYTGSPDNPVRRDLTKAFLFGSKPADAATLPYLAIVLCFGFNLVRHLYIGQVDKIGDYQGGEVCGSTEACKDILQTESYRYLDRRQRYLFNGFSTNGSRLECGFVRAEGGTNPNVERPFKAPYSTDPTADYGQEGALGGFNDEISDYLMRNGLNRYSQGAMVTPINAYMTDGVYGHAPLGRIPGVGTVNMTDLQSEDQVLFGTTPFRCFPQLARSTQTEILTQKSRPLNNSYLAGLAYPDDGNP